MYFRVHWRDCPEFSPVNAESIDWGLRGQDVPCSRCQGSGCIEKNLDIIECPDCEGAGTAPAQPAEGYSCCESPESLYAYFACRFEPDDDEVVIEFSGKVVGYGTDNEPLVIPDMKYVHTLTWAEFKAQLIKKRGGQKNESL